MADDGVVFLSGTGEESGNVDEADDGDVEGVAEAYEACGLARGVAVEHTGEDLGLVGHDADALAVEACEADDDVACKLALYLHELSVVDDGADDLVHVVGLVGVVGDDFVQTVLTTVDGVVAFHAGRTLAVVLGDIGKELA